MGEITPHTQPPLQEIGRPQLNSAPVRRLTVATASAHCVACGGPNDDECTVGGMSRRRSCRDHGWKRRSGRSAVGQAAGALAPGADELKAIATSGASEMVTRVAPLAAAGARLTACLAVAHAIAGARLKRGQ